MLASSPHLLRSTLLDLIPYWEDAKYFVILLDADLLSSDEITQISEVIMQVNSEAEKDSEFEKLHSLKTLLQGIAKQEALERTVKQIDPLYFPA
jgi:hypothetical protein